MEFETMLDDAIWIANSLFTRGKATGSSANLSFRCEDKIYITGTGTCFGRLKKDDFAIMKYESVGDCLPMNTVIASKEFPLHLAFYRKSEDIKAVIHTHSFYSTVFSCFNHEKANDIMPDITPYLKMKVGTIGLVPYARPGSKELFALFGQRIKDDDAFLLANHGPIVAGSNLMNAFYGIEELEENARIALHFRNPNL
ncbi:class II aldolase/adducin family protein [Youngiibacter multivorans]|uniref:Ribulose-5-phosphate 4-epimerase/fuculose-1-phosphate aldolase n=1 Tax=Youngiibacter multivorans TaxID=937251 RepID=A0ABS4G7W5_9CLOT|nr:class II aldolase/adducin family protein [Youngiibacter multivorans]MBP1920658.1 ribulose-5-phosphate 4-epimerase/fuculose-1-phosphate aldolase [Youngiibacter multivorans]